MVTKNDQRAREAFQKDMDESDMMGGTIRGLIIPYDEAPMSKRDIKLLKQACESDIEQMQREIAEWADTIIPDRTPHDATVKLMLEEIPEFCLNPTPGEFADLVILIFDIAHLMNINIHDAVRTKMAQNRARKWEVNERGQISHIGDDDGTDA